MANAKKNVHKIAPQLFGLRQAKREACGFCKFHRPPAGGCRSSGASPQQTVSAPKETACCPGSLQRAGAFLSDKAVRAGAAGGFDRLQPPKLPPQASAGSWGVPKPCWEEWGGLEGRETTASEVEGVSPLQSPYGRLSAKKRKPPRMAMRTLKERKQTPQFSLKVSAGFIPPKPFLQAGRGGGGRSKRPPPQNPCLRTVRRLSAREPPFFLIRAGLREFLLVLSALVRQRPERGVVFLSFLFSRSSV